MNLILLLYYFFLLILIFLLDTNKPIEKFQMLQDCIIAQYKGKIVLHPRAKSFTKVSPIKIHKIRLIGPKNMIFASFSKNGQKYLFLAAFYFCSKMKLIFSLFTVNAVLDKCFAGGSNIIFKSLSSNKIFLLGPKLYQT